MVIQVNSLMETSHSYLQSSKQSLNSEIAQPKDFNSCKTDNYAIICHSNRQDSQAETLMHFLQSSMDAYFTQLLPSAEKTQRLQAEFHFHSMQNLLLSCREEVQVCSEFNNNTAGGGQSGCNFAICYKYGDSLYCLKTPGIEVYQFTEESDELMPVCKSTLVMYSKRLVTTVTKSTINSNMPRIKSEFMVARVGYEMDCHIHSPVMFQKLKLEDKHKRGKMILGPSQTFGFISPLYIPKFLKSKEKEKKMSFTEKVQLLLEEARKKMRTIYKQNLHLISWIP